MRKIAFVSLAALATTLSVTAASAQSARHGYGYGYGSGAATETPYIDANQARQRAQIEQGRRSGQITRSEYQQLMAEQDRIASMERRAKADGFADPAERRRIREAQESAGRQIYHESHDTDTRWNRWVRRWW